MLDRFNRLFYAGLDSLCGSVCWVITVALFAVIAEFVYQDLERDVSVKPKQEVLIWVR